MQTMKKVQKTQKTPTVITVSEYELNALLRYDNRLTWFTACRSKPNVCHFDHKDHLC